MCIIKDGGRQVSEINENPQHAYLHTLEEENKKMREELKHVAFCLGARVNGVNVTADCYRAVVENLYIYLMGYRAEKEIDKLQNAAD